MLTGDSYETHTYFEGYYTNRFIQNGQYKFYANLWLDQQNRSFVYQFYYRYDQGLPLQPLYPQPLPQLSLQSSWLSDPSPTWAKVDAGTYTDLQPAATATFPTAGAPAPPVRVAPVPVASAGATASTAAQAAPALTEPTRAQLAVVREWIAGRHASSQPRGAGLRVHRGPPGLVPVGPR